jgi:uncharacterized protein (DUF1330 family)
VPNPTTAVNPSAESIADLAARDDDDAIIMVNLMKFAQPDGRARYARYGAVSGKEIQARGGRVIYSGVNLTPSHPGESDWDTVALVHYPRRAAWLDMQNAPAYQAAIEDRTAGLTRRLLYAFVASERSPALGDIPRTNTDEIAVVNLLRYNDDGGKEEYQTYGKTAGSMIRELGGEVLLHLTGEQAMVSDGTWDHFILVRYPTLDALRRMTSTPRWQAADRDHRQKSLAKTIAMPTRQHGPDTINRATN